MGESSDEIEAQRGQQSRGRPPGERPVALTADFYICPHPECRVLAHRKSYEGAWSVVVKGCQACDRLEVWLPEPAPAGRMVYPVASAAPPPDPGLQGEVLADYTEAAAVLPISARASAALLRLAIERLVQDVGQHGGDLNEGIGILVKDHNLPATVQQALDVVRVIGNEGVHAGTMDLRDDSTTALQLFALVNLIADYTITMPERVGAIYRTLPPTKLAGIDNRDRPDDDD